MKQNFLSLIIPAGGSGKRMGSPIPKQLLKLTDKSILELTLERVQSFNIIQEIILVLPKNIIEENQYLLGRFPKLKAICLGGKERQDSVLSGLQAVSEEASHIFVHDAVRPFVEESFFQKLLDELTQIDCAAVGLPVSDTIKQVDDKQIVESTPNRDKLWAVQTPQGMKAEHFRSCYAKLEEDHFLGTDEAMIAERYGLRVKLLEGSPQNIKMTRPEDLIIAKQILQKQESKNN